MRPHEKAADAVKFKKHPNAQHDGLLNPVKEEADPQDATKVVKVPWQAPRRLLLSAQPQVCSIVLTDSRYFDVM